MFLSGTTRDYEVTGLGWRSQARKLVRNAGCIVIQPFIDDRLFATPIIPIENVVARSLAYLMACDGCIVNQVRAGPITAIEYEFARAMGIPISTDPSRLPFTDEPRRTTTDPSVAKGLLNHPKFGHFLELYLGSKATIFEVDIGREWIKF